jgi:hypothetical protein
MTTTAALERVRMAGLGWWLANVATITGRNLHRLVRVPTLIAFATAQPILFVLLFTAWGGAIHPPGVSATSTTPCRHLGFRHRVRRVPDGWRSPTIGPRDDRPVPGAADDPVRRPAGRAVADACPGPDHHRRYGGPSGDRWDCRRDRSPSPSCATRATSSRTPADR